MSSLIRPAYLGAPNDHARSITAAFAGAGVKLAVLPDSLSWGVYGRKGHVAGPGARLRRMRAQLQGTRDSAYLRMLVEAIDAQRINTILAFWSSALLADLAAIKHARPAVKLVLCCLCHPLSTTYAKVQLQHWQFRRLLGCLDGLLVPGRTMQQYLARHILRDRPLPTLVWPPGYSEALLPKRRRPACDTTPNVLFLGRMDWYRAQRSDDVRPTIDALLAAGVHVYHHQAEGITPHPCRHTFEYKSLPEAVEYATAFDASLICYSTRVCQVADRFAVTVPDRLLASVLAGIPIALPRTGYAACQEYLQPYGAALEFTEPQELAATLRDRAAIAALRETAAEQAPQFTAERRLPALLTYLETLLSSEQIPAGAV